MGFAVFTSNLLNADNDLVFTAKTAGVAVEAVSIKYIAPTIPDQPLSVSVSGNAITVDLQTDAISTLITTSAEVKAAIEADALANALVTVTHAGADTGVGYVSALAESFLDFSVTELITIPTGLTVVPAGMTFANNALDYQIDGPGSIVAPVAY